jgi:polysaccharide deacetylase family protein (PEP-CTERM system associated)
MERTPPSAATSIVNAMTIDVEEYFHVSAFDGVLPRSRWDALESRVCATTERVLRILDDADVLGTFFILGCVAEKHPGLVRSIAAAGHEIASHGYAHRLVYDQTPAAFRADVARAKQVLEDVSGTQVLGFRAPSYSVTPRSLWAFDVLIETGHLYDASIFPIRHDRYGIPVSARHPYVIVRDGGSLIEVPATTWRWAGMNLPVAGGGYFRLLPYAWTRFGIDRVNRVDGGPAIFYFHPWELDPEQPRLPCGWLSRIRHYRNLHLTEGRLRRLLRDFRFAPVRSTLDTARTTSKKPLATAYALPYLW